MGSNSSIFGEVIKQSTEAVGNFLRWIAELIVARNWFSLLILSAIAGLFLFNPASGLAFKVLNIEPPGGYALGFWLAEAGLLLVALVIAVRTMPPAVPASRADTADRKAIKGLRPFDVDDAEVFRQLQRQANLRECLESITSGPFRFGILHRESGCGKTSFLQAGVLPQLAQEKDRGEAKEQGAKQASVGGVYVRFSDQEPVRTIAKAIAEQLEIPLTWLLPEGPGPADLMEVLGKVAGDLEQPLILLLDQFEQFFAHHKRKAQRQSFIQSLANWYKGDRTSPIRIVVSVRSDLMYQLDEIHQALGYSLAPQEVFRLEKFTPSEASRVLEVIAKAEGLAFNREFVTELAQSELANREDGLISPVDLQILSWMIERQTATELRAFNRSAFEKFGGVEGLLQRFLERTLEARVTENQRQSVVKVLLALTDLERQVRAGMLTVPELKAKLKGSAKTEEISEAISWLGRGDVRLITPQEKEGEVAYELAHERLIPALMRQVGKELSAVDQANQLMDRRVNEWLGNRCDRRYYFGPRELWLLRQQQPYLKWGAKREQKEKLLRLSRRRVYGGFAALLVAVMMSSSFFGWLNFTTTGQIQNIQWQLSGLVKEASSGAIVADAAVAFAKNDQWEKAFKIVEQSLQAKTFANDNAVAKDKDVATFVVKSADFWVRTSAPKQDPKVLKRLQTTASAIQSDRSKSDALREIASAYGELEDAAQAKAVLSKAVTVAQAIQNDGSKSSVLSGIAAAAGKLEDAAQAKAVLSEAVTVANAIQNDFSKSSVLSEIAAAYGELDDAVQAKAVLSEAVTVVNAIQGDSFKSAMLIEIAVAAGELDDVAQAKAVLSEAVTVANTIQSDSYKSDALREIAATGVALADEKLAGELLEEILGVAHRERTSVPMVIIANHYAKTLNWSQALHALSKAEKREKTIGLSKLLTTLAEHKQSTLIQGAIVLPTGVKGVDYSGQPGNYTFKVKLQSPDKTCKQRADWWEVITPEGALIKRQVMNTVHKDEQAFESDELDSLALAPDQTVIIRAHFNGEYVSEQDLLVDERISRGYIDKSGYTDQALKGSISKGFNVVRISENFAPWLEETEPLPDPKACSDK
ncbi:MAG: hypothetical protein AAGC93_07085 [Cyanobacteria bacterium P01_F01_bin.53]